MKRILVAEDNDSNYMLMTYILKKYYQFFRARNGQEAVELAQSEKPDLVLMDIKMPIIALTANAFDSDRQLAIEAGCNDFLAKPVNAELCIKTIQKCFGES